MTGLEDLPLFRQRGPETSRIAASMAAGLRADHHDKIVRALRLGAAGASEIGARCGLEPHQVGKRLHELEKVGAIVQTGRRVNSLSGRPEREWRVA
jgi:predicted ArsR family transcriptional regulator